MITIIGRGHSGTRAISHTLSQSGVYMGADLNVSGDLVPPGDMYEACRIFGTYVEHKDGLEWDFSKVTDPSVPIDPAFTKLIESYLASVLSHDGDPKGWKIPETTLCYPWIQRLFPDINYIFWIRNPRDCIIGGHVTDDMRDFNVDYPTTDDERMKRAISWKYQYDLVKATPLPKKWTEVRFEDFVLRQDDTLAKLKDYLGFDLAKIEVRPDATTRWKSDEGVNYFDFFAPAMKQYGYEAPVEA